MLVPGSGDEAQALKAGIMEIADIFVVNKADREGADRTPAPIETVLALPACADGGGRPPSPAPPSRCRRRVPGRLRRKPCGHISSAQGRPPSSCSKPRQTIHR